MMFWNARMGIDGCRKAGYVRIAYGVICLVDRLFLAPDLEYFLHPTDGVLEIDQQPAGPWGVYSLLRFHNNNSDYIWFLWALGVLNAFLLILGIAPRLNALLLHVNNCSFHFANDLLCDGTDTGICPLMRLYNTFFFFMPLHHITVFDGFGFRKRNTNNSPTTTDNDSWPMWPVWLFQWQSVLVYAGAGAGKWDGPTWREGTAMYYISFGCPDECKGWANPEFILNHMIVLKIASWTALVVESLAPFTIWFYSLRIPTLVAVTFLHLGMDITMQMHTFQPLVLVGWYTFLIRPMTTGQTKASPIQPSTVLSRVVGAIVYLTLLTCSLSMALPWPQIGGALEEFQSSLMPYFEKIVDWNDQVIEVFAAPITSVFGIEQGVWALFNGGFHGDSLAATVVATLSDGSEVEDFWTTPDWVNMPRLEHKRMFNHVNFYKHLSVCRGCSEQRKLLHRLAAEPRIQEMGILQLVLYSQDVYPPPPPEDAGWWGPVRQPLVVDWRGFEMGLILCRTKEEDYCGDHELVFDENKLLNEDEIEEGYYLGDDDEDFDEEDEEDQDIDESGDGDEDEDENDDEEDEEEEEENDENNADQDDDDDNQEEEDSNGEDGGDGEGDTPEISHDEL